jgi:hypothetical protein
LYTVFTGTSTSTLFSTVLTCYLSSIRFLPAHRRGFT